MKILVLGDLIVDKYTYCECSKISPEAPVPVLVPKRSEHKLGGAANVAACLAALGVDTVCASIVGDDESACVLKNLLEAKQIKAILHCVKGRTTSSKERLLAMSNQIARIDKESCEPASSEAINALLSQLDESYDAVVISDYAKGAITRELVLAAQAKSPLVLADPKNDFSLLKGCSVITPNLKEAKQFSGELNDDKQILNALKKLQSELEIARPIITLSERGIATLDDEGSLLISPAQASEVYDVTGAGDSVIAALAYQLASKASIQSALKFANDAAAITVSKIGTYAPTLAQINKPESKLVSLKMACELAKNKRAVWTNGCFDVLHAGHVSYLQKARELGDMLIVGLNSDASVRALKGPQRPINSQADRAAVLEGLKSVDLIVIFDELTPLECIRALRPAVLAKGADYKIEEVIGREFASEVALIDFLPGRSSSNLIKKCKDN